MKIRNGFVSNSSSSSFIVGFDKIPTLEELQKLMFGDQKTVGYDDDSVSTNIVVDRIFRDLQRCKPLNKTELLEEIKSGYFEGYPDAHCDPNSKRHKFEREFRSKYGHEIQAAHDSKDAKKLKEYNKWCKLLDKEFDARRKEVGKAAEQYLEREWPRLEGKVLYAIEYSDNDGTFESTMEHGDIFNRIPHIRISHH